MTVTLQKRELQDTIESLIDQHNLTQVLEAIADICFEKAKHLRQDEGAAKSWERDGSKISGFVCKLSH